MDRGHHHAVGAGAPGITDTLTGIEADQIAVIEDGRVVEAGSPDDLMERGGRYAGWYCRWVAGAA